MSDAMTLDPTIENTAINVVQVKYELKSDSDPQYNCTITVAVNSKLGVFPASNGSSYPGFELENVISGHGQFQVAGFITGGILNGYQIMQSTQPESLLVLWKNQSSGQGGSKYGIDEFGLVFINPGSSPDILGQLSYSNGQFLLSVGGQKSVNMTVTVDGWPVES